MENKLIKTLDQAIDIVYELMETRNYTLQEDSSITRVIDYITVAKGFIPFAPDEV